MKKTCSMIPILFDNLYSSNLCSSDTHSTSAKATKPLTPTTDNTMAGRMRLNLLSRVFGIQTSRVYFKPKQSLLSYYYSPTRTNQLHRRFPPDSLKPSGTSCSVNTKRSKRRASIHSTRANSQVGVGVRTHFLPSHQRPLH